MICLSPSPQNAKLGTGRNMEVDIFENRRARIVGEGEIDMLEIDGAFDTPLRNGTRTRRLRNGQPRVQVLPAAGTLLNARLRGKQFAYLDAGCVETLPVIGQPAGLAHRTVDHPQIRVERDQIAKGHMAIDDKEAAQTKG